MSEAGTFGLARPKIEGVSIYDGVETMNPGDKDYDEARAKMREAAAFYEEAGVTPPHGLTMYGFNVLVKPKAVEEKIGNVYIPDTHKDKLEFSVTEGELVAISAVAFSYETWPAGTRLPRVGDKVTYGKFVGAKVTGNDGVDYRVMEDKEILAVRS